jgi:membrane-bound lytic murein transglycosylase D
VSDSFRHSRSTGFAGGAGRLALLILVASGLAGCAYRHAPSSSPVEERAAADTAPDPQAVTELELILEPSEETGCVAAGPEPFEQNQLEDPLTESPLDELAGLTPELAPEELERERDLVTAQAPTFDIPIVLNDRVLAWVDVYSKRLKPHFEQGLARSTQYNTMFRGIFADYGLPQDLVYMAAVESGYKTSAYSRAHARGIFQFISATGRRYGLRVDYWVDERSDPEKSAHAAAAYMKDLYEEFGDWYLALAAYNAGEGTVRRAIRREGTRDFWQLAKGRNLRRETKNHVPAILAATVLSKEPEKYGLSYTPMAPLSYDTVHVDGAADLRVLARCAGTDVATLKGLNPALRRNQTPPEGSTDLRVPEGLGESTRAALEAIPLSERVLYARYRVERGDTLSTIARRYGVTVSAIQGSNQMGRRTLIREKQILLIPTSASTRYGDLPEAEGDTEVLVYRVHRGDTLYGIARRYGTTPAAIAAASDISVNELLQIGDHLKVVRGVKSARQAREMVENGSTTRVARSSGGGGSSSQGAVIHTVSRGDTLWHLARRYDTSVNELCVWNRISPRTVIRPGAQLTVGYK